MTLLAITTQTWIVTGLGFGIVLLLLTVFVYVMKLLGWIMQPRKAAAPVQQPASVSTVVATATPVDADAQELAAVAYALYLSHNDMHDTDTCHLTIHAHATGWNSKSFGINNL